MTVSTTIVRKIYSGDGSTTTFAYVFKIFATSDLQVIIRSATGVELLKQIDTDYTLTGVGNTSGGNVVFESGKIPTSTETVVLIRNVPQTQAIDYIANDPFPAETHEEGLDRATMTIQQMQEALDRSFKVSRTNTISSSEFTDSPTTRASKTLGFDSNGNLTTVADFLPAGGDSALFQYATSTTDGDPGAGKFRLNNATISSATQMYIDDLEFNGTNVEAWIQSWDDVVGNDTNRGRIRISKANSLDTWIVFRITGGITNASGYSKVNLVYIDSAGTLAADDKTFISFVASGEDGSIPGYFYKFGTGTANTDPGSGKLKFNNATYASATAIYIDDNDANGVAVVTDILTWDDSTSTIKGYLMIYDIKDRSTYARFKITGSSTDASGYVGLAVAHLASNNTFSTDDELSVTFVRNGDTGDTGNTGSTGNTGNTGSTGPSGTNSQLSMTWSSSTSDADPGSGKLAFNNGTISSVSVLHIDDLDDSGATISSFVQSWDDVSNGVARGIVTVTKEGTPSTFALFKVTGAVTNASGYSKVAVTHVVSNGTFSNTNGIGVHFSYSGVDGTGNVSTDGVQTLTNKTLTSPKINENVALSSTATELNKLDALSRGSIIYGNASAATAVLTKGSANTVLTSDGTDISWQAVAGRTGAVSWDTTPKTGQFTAANGVGYFVNTVNSAFAVLLPSGTAGDIVAFADYAETWQTNKVTVTPNGTDKIGSLNENAVLSTKGQSVTLVFVDSTQGWINTMDSTSNVRGSPPFITATGGTIATVDTNFKTHTFTGPGTFAVTAVGNTAVGSKVSYMVIAGGASGSGGCGSGGGAGGFREGKQACGGYTASPLAATPCSGLPVSVQSYPITIGAGGANVPIANSPPGNQGANSVFSSITSAGGGKAGGGANASPGVAGTAGGSGGGGNPRGQGGAGNTPTVSPSQGNAGGNGVRFASPNPQNTGGGGGGATSVGSNGTQPVGGDGGNGAATSISGSSVTRAGGGGGGAGNAGPNPGNCGPTAGSGGGGGGGNPGTNAPDKNATANTGSGGGGGGASGTAGAGGAGVVVIRYKFQ